MEDGYYWAKLKDEEDSDWQVVEFREEKRYKQQFIFECGSDAWFHVEDFIFGDKILNPSQKEYP